MAQKKMGLGKGLGALLSIYDEEVEELQKEAEPKTAEAKTKEPKKSNGVEEIAIKEIHANPNHDIKQNVQHPIAD